MRNGLSLQIIGSVVLALVGVTVLVGAFSSSFGGVFESGFCRIYNSVSYLFPGQTPGSGSCTERTVEYREIEATNVDDLKLVLISTITNCWDEYKGYFSGKKLCGGFSLRSYTGPDVTEGAINDKMDQNSICPEQIENSNIEDGGSTTCGGTNQIRFKGGAVSSGDLVVVSYNASESPPEEWIVVK